MTPCTFPHKEPIPATTRNRSGQPVCEPHRTVVVAMCGPKSKRHEDDGGAS